MLGRRTGGYKQSCQWMVQPFGNSWGRNVAYEHLVAGNEPASKIQQFLPATRWLKNLVEDYVDCPNRNIIQVLRGTSYNYAMNL